MSIETKAHREKLHHIVREMAQRDKDLREKYEVGDKFKFIRDRINALLSRVEDYLSSLEIEQKQESVSLSPDEVLVYVYLYNAQGSLFKTWQNMVSASVFYEYSVNRPIYTEKSHLEAYIRSKTNKNQHAYLVVAIKQSQIMTSKPGQELKDTLGNPVVKVKEGSLHFDKLVAFIHQEQHYVVKGSELVRQ